MAAPRREARCRRLSRSISDELPAWQAVDIAERSKKAHPYRGKALNE